METYLIALLFYRISSLLRAARAHAIHHDPSFKERKPGEARARPARKMAESMGRKRSEEGRSCSETSDRLGQGGTMSF